MAKYPDTPLSNFPDAIDNMARMSDLSYSLIAIAIQYNTLYDNGDTGGAKLLLENNPALENTIFNAEKWNKLRDAIIALQRFFSEEVKTFIERVAQYTLGINDNPTEEEKLTCTYSAKKLDTFINTKSANLLASAWSATAPYKQRVTVPGLKSTDDPSLGLDTPSTLSAADTKLRIKYTAMITDGTTEDGYMTFYCGVKKPTGDFSVKLRGVSTNG